MAENNKVIYTAIIGDYDNLIEPHKQEGWRYMCFTDQPIKSQGWEVVQVEGGEKVQRDIKSRPHHWLPDHDVSVWVDGNIKLGWDLDVLACEGFFVAMDHPDRLSIYEEAEAVVRLQKDAPEVVHRQMADYQDVTAPLLATGVLARRNTKQNREAGEMWWREIAQHSRRDQLSLPYVVQELGLEVATIPFLDKCAKYPHKGKFTPKQEVKRYHIINNLIAERGYKSYLEIGVQGGLCFGSVKCRQKVGVDPDPSSRATMIMTSDDFFAETDQMFDIIFIDGLHEAEQVKRDIYNSLEHLNEGGIILMHDCLPWTEEMQNVPRTCSIWTGDAWKAFVFFRRRDDLSMHTIDTDFGIGVIERGEQEPLVVDDPTWEGYRLNRREWMNID